MWTSKFTNVRPKSQLNIKFFTFKLDINSQSSYVISHYIKAQCLLLCLVKHGNV